MVAEVDERLIKGSRDNEEMASDLDNPGMRLPTNPTLLASQVFGRPTIYCGASANIEGYFPAFHGFAFSNVSKEKEIRGKGLCS